MKILIVWKVSKYQKEVILRSRNFKGFDSIRFIVFLRHFQKYFSFIMATSFSGGRSRSTRREPPTMDKQLVNFITCGCELSAPLLVIYNARREHTLVLLIGLYELLGNPTT
jgi:hypothetical protein